MKPRPPRQGKPEVVHVLGELTHQQLERNLAATIDAATELLASQWVDHDPQNKLNFGDAWINARLSETGIGSSVGSRGDSYDNALAEMINGLFKKEVIHRRVPRRNREAIEYATLQWVDWFNQSATACIDRQRAAGGV